MKNLTICLTGVVCASMLFGGMIFILSLFFGIVIEFAALLFLFG